MIALSAIASAPKSHPNQHCFNDLADGEGDPPLFRPFLFAFLLSLKPFAFALSLHRTEKLATQAKDALDSLSFYYT